MPDVVRVEDRALGDLPQTVAAHAQDVRVCPDQEGEVSVPRAYLADRLRAVVVQVIAPPVQVDLRHGQERLERLLYSAGPPPRASPAGRRRGGLMQVEVPDV